MDVTGSRGLEHVTHALSERLEAHNVLRRQTRLEPFDGSVRLTWYEGDRSRLTIPLLWLDDESDEHETLRTYFSSARTDGWNDDDTYAALEDPDTIGQPLALLAKAARAALHTYDTNARIRALDLPQMIEMHLHDTSRYTRHFEAELADYYASAFTNEKFLELMFEYAFDIGSERIKREIVRGMRSIAIPHELGSHVDPTITLNSVDHTLAELSAIAGVEGTAENIVQLEEAKDHYLMLSKAYFETTVDLIKEAMNNHPARIAYADEHARNADEWLETIS